jgi:high-affinity iron transporter
VGGIALGVAALGLLIVMIWQGIAERGAPDPTVEHLSRGSVILNSAILVFREGLEAILVLAAITASMMGENAEYRRPVAAGAGVALLATIATWFIVIAVISTINAPALDIQAATGLLAIIILLVIMNWFFHSVYWTGWISHHTQRRRRLLERVGDERTGILLGFALLGFTAMYREGFEIVLFLQALRLQVGSAIVLQGVALGVIFTAIVAVLTFIAHHRLPYKKMLVLTGVMLGVVLVIMVGENVQEMQLANWLPTTDVALPIPDWMGIWFAIFPNVEGLVAQALAAAIVIGSYIVAGHLRVRLPRRHGETPAYRPEQPPTRVTASS